MGKYEKEVLNILKKEVIQSTNEILTELQQRTGKVVNWNSLYRILMELHLESKVERLKSKAGFFWLKK